MTQKKLQLIYFFAVLTLVIGLTIWMFLPYIGTLVMATTCAVVLHPVYKRIVKLFKGVKSVAALFTMLIGTIIFLIPVVVFGVQVFQESSDLYIGIQTQQKVITHVTNDVILKNIEKHFPGLHIAVGDVIKQTATWFFSDLGKFFSGTLETLIHILIFTIAVYYLLKDGLKLKDAIIHLSPLLDEYDQEVYTRLTRAMRSIFTGSLFVALLQGILTGVGLAIFGVPNATLWGGVASICSLVPGVGTSLVWIPATIYLYSTATPTFTAGFFLWSVLLVSTIDNFISPAIVGRGVKIHPFFVLMSVISGLALFGPAGFIFGPLLLSLLFALLDIYRMLILKEKVKKGTEFFSVPPT